MERLNKGKKYYFIEDRKIYTEIESNHELDNTRFAEGNYFLTKEDAKEQLLNDLMVGVESVDRVLIFKDGVIKADISYLGINEWGIDAWKVAEINYSCFQEVSSEYVRNLLKEWNAVGAKSEYKDGVMTIFVK